MVNENSVKERVFSIELRSRRNLRNVSLADGPHDSALVEGTFGELVQASFMDGVILEVVGKRGVLRIDLSEDEIVKTVDKCKEVGETR